MAPHEIFGGIGNGAIWLLVPLEEGALVVYIGTRNWPPAMATIVTFCSRGPFDGLTYEETPVSREAVALMERGA